MGKLKRNEYTRASYFRNPYYHKELWHFAPFPEVYNREEIIEYLINTNLVEWYTCKLFKKPITDDKVKDYVQEIWLQILQIPDEKLESLWYQGYPAVTGFVSKIIQNNVISVTSPAYRHICKANEKLIHVDSDVWDEVTDYDTYPDLVKEILLQEDSKIDNWKDYE